MSRFLGSWRVFFEQATDAPLEYGEAAGLMCLATLAIGRRQLGVGKGIRPNLFMLITGDSSIARKSTAVRFAWDMIKEVAPDRVGPTDYTMEGLFKWMKENKGQDGKGKSKLTLFAAEFGADLARRNAYGSTMAEDLCHLYDGEEINKVRSKSESITIDKPRVNLLGAIAYPLMEQYLTVDDWFTGFLMRFVYVRPIQMRPTALLQPDFPRTLWDNATAALLNLRDQLNADIDSTRENRVSIEPRARMKYEAFIRGLEARNDQRHIVATYLARFGTNVLKLALLYQIDLDPDQPVSEMAMDYAIWVSTAIYWPAFLRAYELTNKTFDAFLKLLLLRIKENGGSMPKLEVYREFGGKRDLNSALATLVTGGFIKLSVTVSPTGEPHFVLLNEM